MSKNVVEVDDDALDTARELLGTRTTKDTVNVALRDGVRRRKRLLAFDGLRKRARQDDCDERLDSESHSTQQLVG